MNIQHVGTQDRYLALPSRVQRSKNATFAYIKENVGEKALELEVELTVSGWEGSSD